MIKCIHFIEDNVPFSDEPFDNTIIFEDNNNNINMEDICQKIEELKDNMDMCPDDADIEAMKIYNQYSDEGWHEKIDIAFDIVAKKFGLTKLNVEPYTFSIN